MCTTDELAFCGNKAKVSPGDTCATAAAANGLTVNQLLGFNRQLSRADCTDLVDQDVCLPSPPPEAVSQCAMSDARPASTACDCNGVSHQGQLVECCQPTCRAAVGWSTVSSLATHAMTSRPGLA